MLFLRDMRTSRTCPVVGWSQGIFQVRQDEKGQEILLDNMGNKVLGLEQGKVLIEEPTTESKDVLILSDQSPKEQPLDVEPTYVSKAPMSPTSFLAEVHQIVAEQPPTQPEQEGEFITDESQFLPLEPLVASPPPILKTPTEVIEPSQGELP